MDDHRLSRLLSVHLADPAGLPGLWLRGRGGPVRDAILACLPSDARVRGTDDAPLDGGLDLVASLAAGRAVTAPGTLEGAARVTLTLAERCTPRRAARLAQALDDGTAVVALDEGEGDEALPGTLSRRMALHVPLDALPSRTCPAVIAPRIEVHAVRIPDEALAEVEAAARALGIPDLAPPLRCLRAARALAALDGAAVVGADHLAEAAALTLAHHARALPDAGEDEAPPPPEREQTQPTGGEPPSDMMIDAARAALDPALLPPMTAKGGSGQGAGAARTGTATGRPLPSRPGRASAGRRIDVVATLAAAAPWQRIRRDASPVGWNKLYGTAACEMSKLGHRVIVRASDLRIRRTEDRAERCLIFCVDASGSHAMARMAEAKGAVECLLAEAYRRRDRVALVAFRGDAAETLLPPTKSLVQAKSRLAGVPGGGATPLASGLAAARTLAADARRRGATPVLILMTDGRGNVALDGRRDRAAAAEDADRLATSMARDGTAALVLDTAVRPQPALSRLADRLGARYLPLPRADARALSRAVEAELP